MNRPIFFKKIETLCKELEQEFDLIPRERKEKLQELSAYIARKIEAEQVPKLVVICTHNSRRSHIGQIWLAVGADYFQLAEIQTFSGGTEATAFNSRAVKAFQQVGFEISTANENEDNPIYDIRWMKEMKPYQAFSKRFEDAANPKEQFAGIMVCSQADKDCPAVVGCDFRLSLPYDDPKEFDDTEFEEEKYNERIKQIGREILFSLKQM